MRSRHISSEIGRDVARRIGLALVALAAACGSARQGLAQQNLFNVPSAEITEQGHVFFQEQFNFTRIGTSNTTFDFGLDHHWEVGLNFLDLEFYDRSLPGPSDGQVNPDLLFNVQKGFELDERVKLGVGTQVGFNPSRHPETIQFLNFSWLTCAISAPEDQGRFFVGTYYANHPYRGDGRAVGYLLGAEIPIQKDKFHFMADYISGTSDLSVAVIGAVVFLPSKWQVSFGVQLPSPGSDNHYGFVLELTQTDLFKLGQRRAGGLSSPGDDSWK